MANCNQCKVDLNNNEVFYCTKCYISAALVKLNEDRADVALLARLVRLHIHNRGGMQTASTCACGNGGGGPARYPECRAIQTAKENINKMYTYLHKDLK